MYIKVFIILFGFYLFLTITRGDFYKKENKKIIIYGLTAIAWIVGLREVSIDIIKNIFQLLGITINSNSNQIINACADFSFLILLLTMISQLIYKIKKGVNKSAA